MSLEPRSDRILFAILLPLLLVVLLDCYLDDLLGIAGISGEEYYAMSTAMSVAMLTVSCLLAAAALILLWRLLRYIELRGYGSRRIFYGAAAVSCILLVADQAVRLVVALGGWSTKQSLPAWVFVASYAERLFVYLVVAAVFAILLYQAIRLLRGGARLGMALVTAVLVSAYLMMFASGLGTLSSSPFWSGGSILDGSVWMGSIPRDLGRGAEPLMTYGLLFGLGMLGGLVSRLREQDVSLWLATGIVLVLQTLPKLRWTLVTEVISSFDMYYIFRSDRLVSFTTLPLLLLCAGWLTLSILSPRGEAEG